MTYGDFIFPYNSCHTNEINSINSSDRYFGDIDSNIKDTSNNINTHTLASNLCDNDLDIKLSNIEECKFYSVEEFSETKLENKFNIFHNNVNGLETKFGLLHNFLGNSTSELDLIAITETSHNDNDKFKSNIKLDGYDLFSTPTNSSKGGTAIFSKKKLDVIERIDMKIQHDHFESVWIELKNKKGKNVICGSLYRHPHDIVDIYQNFLNYLETCISKITKENKIIYLCGDFNSDLLKYDDNNNYKKFYDLLSSYGIFPMILLPTRVTDHSATIVDNIFTNNLDKSLISGNILTDFSDHYSQFISIRNQTFDLKTIIIYKRDYSNFSEKSFRNDVSIQNFCNDLGDVNDQFQDFYFKLEGCVDRHAPIKKLTLKEIKLNQKPWIDKELNKLIKIKNKLFNRKKRQPNNDNIKRLYNLFRNRVNRELIKSKKNYYAKYFEENNNNSKKVWEGIRSIINIKNPKSTSISQLKIDDRIIDHPKEIAESINDFFADIGINTEKSIPINPIIKPDKYLKDFNIDTFNISPITNEEILEIITHLDNKSTGPQSIPVYLLQLIADLIIIPLSNIISNSFISGVFPNALKVSKVIPIHKGDSAEEVNNYRPISLLSIFDKIIEKVMYKRLYSFLEQHNILFENQFGFRKNNSTTFALLEITERIKETIDKHNYGCGIFIDLRKAFDTVNHSILLTKLKHYGIRDTSFNWFNSYLSNRKQYVFLNGETSQLRNITCGVPQGSVLGPLLFLIYINDLPNISKILNFYLFADDTNIYFEAETPEKLERVVNKELKELHIWLIVNRLSLNIDKTNFVIFHPYNKPLKHNITLKIQKKAITQKNSVKYLGIMIDSGLTWQIHIDSLSKKISRSIGLLYKIRPFVNKNILKMLYYSLIFSHLSYAIEIWGSADNIHLNRLFILQKRAVRILSQLNMRVRHDEYLLIPSDPLFFIMEILKIHDIFKLRIVKFIFNCLIKNIPSNFYSWFILTNTIHNYNTRSKFIDIDQSTKTRSLFVPFARTTHYGLKLTKVLGSKLWNTLPPLLRVDNFTLKIFIRKTTKYLINQYEH